MNTLQPQCTLCGCESDEIKYLPLYVIGSEGVWACLNCRIALTEAARGLMGTATRVRGQMRMQRRIELNDRGHRLTNPLEARGEK